MSDNTPNTALKQSKFNPNEPVSIVKKESLPDNSSLTTYSNGMQVYTFPAKNTPSSSSALSPLTCGTTPVNSENITADGCACLNFHSFGNTQTPIGSQKGFYYDENKYYAFNASTKPHEYKLYLKITINSTIDQDPEYDWVFYEGYLPWEEPQLASCVDNYHRLIFWQPEDYIWCAGYVTVTTKKVFKRTDITENWNTAVEISNTFYDAGKSGYCL